MAEPREVAYHSCLGESGRPACASTTLIRVVVLRAGRSLSPRQEWSSCVTDDHSDRVVGVHTRLGHTTITLCATRVIVERACRSLCQSGRPSHLVENSAESPKSRAAPQRLTTFDRYHEGAETAFVDL